MAEIRHKVQTKKVTDFMEPKLIANSREWPLENTCAARLTLVRPVTE